MAASASQPTAASRRVNENPCQSNPPAQEAAALAAITTVYDGSTGVLFPERRRMNRKPE